MRLLSFNALRFACGILVLIGILASEEQINPYELLIVEDNNRVKPIINRLVKLSKAGKIDWEYKVKGRIWDLTLTPENKIVFPVIKGSRDIRCLTLNGDVLWTKNYAENYREIINISSDSEGIIASGQAPPQAFIMNFKGDVIDKVPVPAKYQSYHGQVGNIYRFDDNTYCAQLWGEGSVVKFDKQGRELWRFKTPRLPETHPDYPKGHVTDLVVLDRGHLLIACGYQSRLIELDASGKICWSLSADQYPDYNLVYPSALQKLKNGDILVTNYLRGHVGKGVHAYILSADKKIKWTFADHKNFKSTCKIWAIESVASSTHL